MKLLGPVIVVISVLSFFSAYVLLQKTQLLTPIAVAKSSQHVGCVTSRSPGDKPCNFTLTYSALVGNERLEIQNGRPFTFNDSYLRGLGFPIIFNDTMKILTATVDDIVFVTAADAWYFEIDMDAIAKVQQHFPHQKIIFYDLASEKQSRSNVNKIKQMCNVEYRVFDVKRYPPHVQKLKNYAWKPLIVHEVLLSHDVILWMDSSVRFQSNDLKVALNRTDVTGGGPIMFDPSGHSIFSATHAGMYDYLPIEKKMAVYYGMYGANAFLLYRNCEIYESVIRWWFLCAMTPECIMPTTNIYCNFSKTDQRGTYANCHRYDQSAINILTVNHVTQRYQRPPDDYMSAPSSASAVTGLGEGKNLTSQMPGLNSYSSSGPVKIERGSKRNEHINLCDAATKNNDSAKWIPLRTHFGIK